jgi:hypothetical protein
MLHMDKMVVEFCILFRVVKEIKSAINWNCLNLFESYLCSHETGDVKPLKLLRPGANFISFYKSFS